jgi:hypothetical protein
MWYDQAADDDGGFRKAEAAKSSEEKQASWTDSVPTDKADERLRALPMLFSEPVATHRRLPSKKLC